MEFAIQKVIYEIPVSLMVSNLLTSKKSGMLKKSAIFINKAYTSAPRLGHRKKGYGLVWSIFYKIISRIMIKTEFLNFIGPKKKANPRNATLSF